MKINKILLLSFVIASSCFSYNMKTPDMQKIVPVIESEFKACINKQELSVNECYDLKNKQLSKLYRLDMNQSHYNAKKKILEERAELIKNPVEPSLEEITIKAAYEDCVDHAIVNSDLIDCRTDRANSLNLLKEKTK